MGSEMCIRDSLSTVLDEREREREREREVILLSVLCMKKSLLNTLILKIVLVII